MAVNEIIEEKRRGETDLKEHLKDSLKKNQKTGRCGHRHRRAIKRE